MSQQFSNANFYLTMTYFMGLIIIGVEFGSHEWSPVEPLLAASVGALELMSHDGQTREYVPFGVQMMTTDSTFGIYRQLVGNKIVLESPLGMQGVSVSQIAAVYLKRDKSIGSGIAAGIIGYSLTLALTSEYLYTSCSGDTYRYHNDKALAAGIPSALAGYLISKK